MQRAFAIASTYVAPLAFWAGYAGLSAVLPGERPDAPWILLGVMVAAEAAGCLLTRGLPGDAGGVSQAWDAYASGIGLNSWLLAGFALRGWFVPSGISNLLVVVAIVAAGLVLFLLRMAAAGSVDLGDRSVLGYLDGSRRVADARARAGRSPVGARHWAGLAAMVVAGIASWRLFVVLLDRVAGAPAGWVGDLAQAPTAGRAMVVGVAVVAAVVLSPAVGIFAGFAASPHLVLVTERSKGRPFSLVRYAVEPGLWAGGAVVMELAHALFP